MKFKDIIKRNWKKVVSLMIVAGFSVSVLTACGQKNNEITPDPAEQKSEQIDPKPTDPVVEPTNPIIPEDPTSVDPTPVDPQPEDPTPVDPQPVDPKPEDPTPVDPQPTDPEDPTPVDPQPEELDFSALEEKLVKVFEEKNYGVTINDYSYSVSENTLYVMYDCVAIRSGISIYSYTDENLSFESQEAIERISSNINKNTLNTLLSFQKAKTDITVNGETYSKDGIEGDNIFARQCGIDNAYMTYISDLGLKSYSNAYESGYSRIFEILIITEENNLFKYEASVDNNCESDNHWDNFFIEDKYRVYERAVIDLGEPLNIQQDESLNMINE